MDLLPQGDSQQCTTTDTEAVTSRRSFWGLPSLF